jgi:hypothetical protein
MVLVTAIPSNLEHSVATVQHVDEQIADTGMGHLRICEYLCTDAGIETHTYKILQNILPDFDQF